MGQSAAGRSWLRRGGARPPARTRRTVALDTGLPRGAFGCCPQFGPPDLRLSFDGPGRNVSLNLFRLESTLRCVFPPRLRDLLEIASAVYSAEIAFGRTEQAEGDRSRTFLVPVRDLAFWQREEPRLAESLYVLCHGSYVFHFCERSLPDADLAPCPDPDAWREVDSVALLSGGLDSFAGATALLASDRRPLLVVHSPHNPTVLAAQNHVIECLTSRFRNRVEWVAARCGPVRSRRAGPRLSLLGAARDPEPTRAFLYLSLGAAACHATGARRLLCPENGLLALAPTLGTDGKHDGCAATGIQPRTLAPFSQLLSAVGVPAKLENPLIYQTKGQLIRDVLRPHFSPADIQGSVSCWSAGVSCRPCGACISCLIRAVAMRTNGLPREAHLIDPLGTGGMTGLGGRARLNLRRLILLIERLRSLDDEQLPYAYPVLLDLPPDGSIRLAAGMLRQFADEAAQAIYS